MYTLGIDVGSASSKAVILKDGKEIVAQAVIQSGTGTSGPDRVIREIYEISHLLPEDIAYTVATGYGRFSLKADKQVSEITCHAKGVYQLIPTVRTIIDIGGQDAKSIRLDSKGNILKFFMNDKCAAGTGRFLDVMARVMEVDLADMENWHFKATSPVSVSSTCTVFAESEVISQLSKGMKKEDIIAGVHESVASRACALVYRAGDVKEDIVISGGVAQNKGAVDAIAKELGKEVHVAPDPQIMGALGAAYIAWEQANK